MPPALRGSLFTNKPVLIIVALIIIGLAFWVGRSAGVAAGYAQAETDIAALQDEAARQAAASAAESANPFQAVNPLEGVEANPFDKVKKVLNPFEN